MAFLLLVSTLEIAHSLWKFIVNIVIIHEEDAMLMRAIALFVCLAILLIPLAGQAADYRFVDRGDTYYLDHLFENQLVFVLGKENRWVKVPYQNGAVDWVSPSRLLSHSQSQVNDAAEQIAGGAILGLAFIGL